MKTVIFGPLHYVITQENINTLLRYFLFNIQENLHGGVRCKTTRRYSYRARFVGFLSSTDDTIDMKVNTTYVLKETGATCYQ